MKENKKRKVGGRPLILVTNDDGIDTPGIQELAQLMERVGEVIVAAPLTPHSGMSHAITVGERLLIEPFPEGCTSRQYGINGTPADCVKVALHALVPRCPDLVVSGINFGSNASINVLYSGTVSAALEAAVAGIPSIAFSMVRRGLEGGYAPYHPYCMHLVNMVLEEGLPWGVTLNVNFPRKPVQGLRWCRQAAAHWIGDVDSHAQEYCHEDVRYYTIKGDFESLEPEAADTDDYMLRQHYVSVVPTHVDMTAHGYLKQKEGITWQPSNN